MSMGLSLSISLSQRELMEERLEQAMVQKPCEVLELRLYMKREDALKKLYARALKRGDVRMYERHGLLFEYARIRHSEIPSDINEGDSCGFAHCLYDPWEGLLFGTKIALARGSWLLFTVPDYFTPLEFPETYVQYVAVHEHGEAVTLGEHDLASKLEFSVAKTERNLSSYVRWLEDHYPAKFADMFANQSRVVLPDSQDFQHYLELKSGEEYARRVRKCIENFEWPYRILQKLSRYEREGREAGQKLLGGLTKTIEIAKSMPATVSLPEAVDKIRACLTPYLSDASQQDKYICWPRLVGTYHEVRMQLSTAFDAYRSRRQVLTEEKKYMEEVEVIGTGGSLPHTGILSFNIRNAVQAVDR